MNSLLEQLAKNGVTKAKNLLKEEENLYRGGLYLLGTVVNEEFFDLPKLPDDKYGTDGLFYTIPFRDDEIIHSNGNTPILLVVYKIENGTSYCPLMMELEFWDMDNFSIYVYSQKEQRLRRSLIDKEKGKYFSDIPNRERILLSELVNQDWN